MIKRLSIFFVLFLLNFSSISQAAEKLSNDPLKEISQNLNELLQTIVSENEIDSSSKQFVFFVSVLANIELYFEQAHIATVKALAESKCYTDTIENPLFKSMRKLESSSKHFEIVYNTAKVANFEYIRISEGGSYNFQLASACFAAQMAAKKATKAALSEGLTTNEVIQAAYRAAKLSVLKSMLNDLQTAILRSYTFALSNLQTINIDNPFPILLHQMQNELFEHVSIEEMEFLNPWLEAFNGLFIFEQQGSHFLFIVHNNPSLSELPFDIVRKIVLTFGLFAGRKYH